MTSISRLPTLTIGRLKPVHGALAAPLLSLALSLSGTARASSQPPPGAFGLSTTAFPPHSTVVRAHIEANRQIHADNVLHFGRSFTHEGRITGYFMEAIEGRRLSPHCDTSYLVSMFPTSQQAASA